MSVPSWLICGIVDVERYGWVEVELLAVDLPTALLGKLVVGDLPRVMVL